MYYVYIIQSDYNSSYYVGHTDNLFRRVNDHNSGKEKYTSKKSPWVLVYFEEFLTRGNAMKRELEIKNKKSTKFIEYLISKNG